MSRLTMLVALLSTQLTGCLPYVYPTLTYTPEVAVPNQDGSVHAFRVDVDRTQRAPLPTSHDYGLTRISIDTRGTVPSQLELASAIGMLNPFGVIEGAKHERTSFTMLVRLYRPGYRTMEIRAWDKSRELQWLSAPTLGDQERAIDELLAPSDVDPKVTWWDRKDPKDEKAPGLGLQPGTSSVSQRQALIFAAGEFQRLASSPTAMTPTATPMRERMQQKAIWLRRYAEQSPTPATIELSVPPRRN